MLLDLLDPPQNRNKMFEFSISARVGPAAPETSLDMFWAPAKLKEAFSASKMLLPNSWKLESMENSLWSVQLPDPQPQSKKFFKIQILIYRNNAFI